MTKNDQGQCLHAFEDQPREEEIQFWYSNSNRCMLCTVAQTVLKAGEIGDEVSVM